MACHSFREGEHFETSLNCYMAEKTKPYNLVEGFKTTRVDPRASNLPGIPGISRKFFSRFPGNL